MNELSVQSSEEQLIYEITNFISTIVPINVTDVKNQLSKIVTKYHVTKVETEDTHPDLTENIFLFLSAKKLEGLSENTLKNYKLQLGIFAREVKKHTRNISAADVRVFLSKYQHLKMSSLSHKLTVIKSFFSWLAEEEIIKKDPTLKLKPPKNEKRLPKALSIEELELLRESCKTTRQRAMIEVMYATGCRLSEVYKLNVNDINIQSMSCLVIGKGNKQREVYFSFKALYHLKKYLKERTDNVDALFITERKPFRRLSKRAIQTEVKKIASYCDLQHKVHPHVMRHTFATLMLNNGAELVAIQELLGHSSSETTLRYARISEERKREQHKKYLVQ